MKKISIITLFPGMIDGFFRESIVKRAIKKKLVEIELVNLRKFAINTYGSVDDRPYGGGAGMVLRVEPIYNALEKIRHEKQKTKVILTSPKGRRFIQKKAQGYAKLDHLIIIAGHYEGVDERVLEYVDEEVSLGDFVMTGGEITAAAVTDAVVRLIPGVLKKKSATRLESFFEVSIEDLMNVVGQKKILQKLKEKKVKKVTLLEYPQYTRPENFKSTAVPKILLSGNHKDIEEWRLKKSFELTSKKRKDLLR